MFLLWSRQPEPLPVALLSVTSPRAPQGPFAYRHQRAGRLHRRRHRGAPLPPGDADSGMPPGWLRDRRGGKALASDPPGERGGQLPKQRGHHVKTRAFCPQRALQWSGSRGITGQMWECSMMGFLPVPAWNLWSDSSTSVLLICLVTLGTRPGSPLSQAFLTHQSALLPGSQGLSWRSELADIPPFPFLPQISLQHKTIAN